ncbi:putative ATP-grasp-modified RiPP [Streptomyces sp. NPDC006997]|uniref:putative ATP-grasp-modified RiPP n=1 Tax=Streptomyces sp. NPDC006997 TaxID=3155356 RepID=UPI0033EC52D4
MRPFTLQYASPGAATDTALTGSATPYRFDAARQLNVLPDGRPAVSDTALLLAAGTTVSTAGSQSHFDD